MVSRSRLVQTGDRTSRAESRRQGVCDIVKVPLYALLCWCLALTTVSPAWPQDRKIPEVAIQKGLRELQAGNYQQARHFFRNATKLDSESASAHYFLGLTLLQIATEASGESGRTTLLESALSEFDRSLRLDPGLGLATLDISIAQSLLGRFEQAESGYQQYLGNNPDDPLPYLFLAVLYFRQAEEDRSLLPKVTESLDGAQAALERSDRPDSSIEATIRLYRGLVVAESNPEAAREELQRSFELAPDSQAGRASKELLDNFDWAAVARRPWDLTVQLGYAWDTNVILRGENIRTPPREGQEDGRFGMASAFTFRLVDTQDVVLGVGVNTFNSWHGDIKGFDVQTYGANIYTAYSPPQANWLTLGLRYDWDYSFVGRNSFLTRHRVTPQVDIQETDWTSTTLFYQLDVREYFNQPVDRRLDRDGLTHAFGAVQGFELFEMFNRPVTADLSYRYENTRTDGNQFDSRNHIFSLGVTVPLPEDFTFQFINEWEIARYKNPSIFDRDFSVRRDVLYSFIFALTKRFDENLSLRFEVDVFNDDSNVSDRFGQQFFSYDRVIYGLSLMYTF